LPVTKKQQEQEKRLRKNTLSQKQNRKNLKQTAKAVPKPSAVPKPAPRAPLPAKKQGGIKGSVFQKLFGSREAPQTAQQTIPYKEMYRDGICRVTNKLYNKTITFSDINYQLAQNEDKTAIFDGYCDFLNYFDSTIYVQLSFMNQYGHAQDFEKAINIPDRDDDYNSIRREYGDMLKTQLAKGNNGLVKKKYITFGIEAANLAEAKPKLERIEADIIGNFKSLGVTAYPLTGIERLEAIHGGLHPDGKEKFMFSWKDIARTGLSTKDYIAPTSFDFRDGRTFRMGKNYGAVSFISIIAPELNDRLLADYLDMNNAVTVNLHIKSIDQAEAIKTIKRKITEIDAMKINEQKKAVRAGYDMDVIPTDIATFGDEAKNILKELQSRNERMFMVTIIVMNTAESKRKLENTVFAASGIAQKYNCALKRLDFQQEQGLMSSLPIGLNQIDIKRGLTTSSTAIFVPFTTCELFMSGQSLYYGLNALSNNLIMANRKDLKNPKGLYHKGRYSYRKTQAIQPLAAQVDGNPQERDSTATERRAATTEKIFSNRREKGSVLPLFFLLLVRGSIQIIGQSEYVLKNMKGAHISLSQPVYHSYRKLKRGIVQCQH